MSYLPPAHHETSKHDSSNEAKIKEKQNETIPDLNSNLTKLMTHHNQTKEWTTWFLRAGYLPHPTKEALHGLFEPLTLVFQYPVSKNKWLV
jgi:hypothetical protein